MFVLEYLESKIKLIFEINNNNIHVLYNIYVL